jgi:hypothetical protein
MHMQRVRVAAQRGFAPKKGARRNRYRGSSLSKLAPAAARPHLEEFIAEHCRAEVEQAQQVVLCSAQLGAGTQRPAPAQPRAVVA